MAFPWVAVAQAAPGIINAFMDKSRSARDEIPTLQAFVDAMERAKRYSAASANPDDPFFKNQAALYDEMERRDFVKAIQNIMLQNRKARARGDTGFGVNPERRDESRYRAMAEAFQAAKIRSRLQARDTLMKLAGQEQNLAKGYAAPFEMFAGYGDANYDIRKNRQEALGTGIGGVLEAILKQKQPARSVPRNQTVWSTGDRTAYPVEMVGG